MRGQLFSYMIFLFFFVAILEVRAENLCESVPGACPLSEEEEDMCAMHPDLRITMCAQTSLGLDKKFAVLESFLKESVMAKQQIPEAVLTSGQAVFNICFAYRFHNWTWDCKGGSGFFLFDNRTFITNHHILEGLIYKEEISNWDEVTFQDHTGKEVHFQIKGVKFLSKMHDIAVLEVEGYEGLVLNQAKQPPGKRSYVAGYPGGRFKVHPVRNLFPAGDIQYGAFREVFDCIYGVNFSGFSGGPVLNPDGEVIAVFANTVNASSSCPLQMLKKLDFLSSQKIQKIQAFSVKDLQRLRKFDKLAFSEKALYGDRTARFMYFYEELERFASYWDLEYLSSEDLLFEAYAFGHNLAELLFLNKVLDGEEGPIGQKAVVDTMLLEDRDLLAATYFELALFFYENRKNVQKACELWKRAGDLGHPYIDSGAVILVSKGDVVFCSTASNLKTALN